MPNYSKIIDKELERAHEALSKNDMRLFIWLAAKCNKAGSHVPPDGPKKLLAGQVYTNRFRCGVVARKMSHLRKEQCKLKVYENYKMIGHRSLKRMEKLGFIQLHTQQRRNGLEGFTVVTLIYLEGAVFTAKTKSVPSTVPEQVVSNQEVTYKSETEVHKIPFPSHKTTTGEDKNSSKHNKCVPLPKADTTTQFDLYELEAKGYQNCCLAEHLFMIPIYRRHKRYFDLRNIEGQMALNKRLTEQSA